MKKTKFLILAFVALVIGLAIGISAPKWIPKKAKPHLPSLFHESHDAAKTGEQSKTSYDWTLTPAGQQIKLGDFPMGAAMSPDHRYLVVSNDGEGMQSLQVVDLAEEKVIQTIPYPAPEALYLGVVFSPDGKQLYASAGGNNKIRVYNFANGNLKAKYPIQLAMKKNEYPAGITVSNDGRFLYIADNMANAVSKIDLRAHLVVASTPVGNRPYTALLSHDGRKLYVSNWGANTVSVLDPTTMKVQKTIEVGLHPNALLENRKNGQIYVANSDSDTISVIDPKTETADQTWSLLPADGLTGAQPDGLALSPDGKTLYVANAGNNDVAVLSTENGDRQGLIPTAWYPTGAYYDDTHKKLLVMNAKGMGSGPNTGAQFVGNMMRGTLSFVDLPSSKQLTAYTTQVTQNNKPNQKVQVIPQFQSSQSPIKHVIYVIKENRTYDQVFGDIAKGNGDPNLVMFGKDITPNLHKLANQFVLLDNFYADAEVSAQGHYWATGAKANDYVEKNWLANYSMRNRKFEFEGEEEATYPEKGFLWDRADQAGVTFRDYGEFYRFDKPVPADPSIGNRYDPDFVGWNLKYSDVDRVKEWSKEFQQFEANGNLPQLEIVRLPNDHTAGTKLGELTPQSMVAQNDYALGLLVDTVTHSKDWANTAIFVTEDDAQSGLDHVDAHRTESLVISPYTQTGKVDSTDYDTASMLRTMELILGLRPMTQYDAAATPMLNAFSQTQNLTSYTVLQPTYSLKQVNGQKAPAARESMGLDFSQEDKADPNKLNHILWEATKGNKPYPNLHSARS